MKGPNTSDINNILEELNLSTDRGADLDNFEIMSTVSDSKKSQTSILSSLLSKNKKGKVEINLWSQL